MVDPLIYEGFVEELVEVLEIRDNSSELVVSNANLLVLGRKGGAGVGAGGGGGGDFNLIAGLFLSYLMCATFNF